jgi:hypothetical protein
MLKPFFSRRSLVAIICGVFATTGWALDEKDGNDVNCSHFNMYGNPYFGDTHAHTTFSVDAFTQGTETTPEQAYLFAKGAEIGLHPFDLNGIAQRQAQLERPLDFAMVSDHAEFFGEYSICLDPTNPLYSDPLCELLRQRDNEGFFRWNLMLGASPENVARFGFCGEDGSICTDESATVWRRMMDAAEEAYDRSSDCEFTSFIGYEWSGAPTLVHPQRGREVYNLHRNVLFLNTLVPIAPSSYLDAPYPEDLWDDLESECLDYVDRDFECDVLTIPHNSNLSQGLIFEQTDRDGNPYTKALAKRRAKFEPLLEVMQHKGQSECLPTGNDELCNYEIIPWGHLAGNIIAPTEPQQEGFGRYILKEGLAMKDDLGANAFQYGLIGSSDTHLGTPGLVREYDYPGHGGAGGRVREGISDTPEFNPGGLAVVWATQNSRAALFDAMRRREVYATSGPRHIVRFYGSWDLPADICSQPSATRTQLAFNNAVPMGAVLPPAGEGQTTPQFLVSALKDLGTTENPGNDLQRIQIIKGWTDSEGVKHEAIHEVAGNPNNGASVDTSDCAVIGTGEDDLCALWQDTGFDPDQNAFYYARVVENPSCRWTQHQCIAADPAINCAGTVPEEYAACCDPEIPKTVQERSWTSPIWYNEPPPPGGGCW